MASISIAIELYYAILLVGSYLYWSVWKHGQGYVTQNMTFQFVSGERSVVSEYRIFSVLTHHSLHS